MTQPSGAMRIGWGWLLAPVLAVFFSFLQSGVPAFVLSILTAGLLLAAILPPRPSPIVFAARALILGPVAIGLLATGLELLGLGRLWLPVITVFNFVTVIALVIRERSNRATFPPDDSGVVSAAWIGLLLCLAVGIIAAVRPWIAQRADSWFHASVVAEIQRAGVPPRDPYFAGFRLQYMWFYHMIVLALVRSSGLSPFFVMAFLNALTIGSLCLLAADVLAALGFPGRPAGWAAVILPLGLGALFWVFFPVRAWRALTGHVSGLDRLAAAFRLHPLNVPTTRAFLSDFESVPFFLNKFLTGTAYGLALAFLLLYLASLLRFAATGRRSLLVTAGLCVFAMLLLHPVVGLTVLAVSGLTGVSMALLGRRGGLSMGQVVSWGLAVFAGAALALPYLRSVTRGKPGDQLVPFHFDLWIVVGIAIGCFFVILAALGPIRRLWRAGRPEGRLIVIWAVMTAIFGSVIRLPGPNTTDKFTYLVYVPLALLAGIRAANALRGARGLVVAVLILAPVNLIGYAGYWGDADMRERSPEDVRLYDWIATNTPRDAVFLENRERVGVLVLGPRRLYWGRQAYADQWGYDRREMARRRGLRDAMYAPGAAVDPEMLGVLRTVGAPVYVIFRSADFTYPDGFHKLDAYPAAFTPVFQTDAVRIYRLSG